MTTRWVLLRGLARESAHWSSFVRQLRAATGDDVVTLDMPGTGTRRDRPVPWAVAGVASSCREALPAHGGPTVLLALSLGAMVALEWCRQDAGGVAGCVLLNTSAGGSPFWQRLRPVHYPALVRMAAGLSTRERERRVLAMTSARPQQHPDAVALWETIARNRPVRAATVLRQLWSAAWYRAPAGPPAVPMLLLASAADRLVSPACSIRLAGDWQVPLRVHPWAGHDLPLDDPAWVIDQAVDWRRGLERLSV
ncbi:MAG: alpha/beta hydrolase [Comamonadaceae bacterium]|nr:MAG: alpha/beta hydrolase [Comamonadaceae bacterium]